MTPPRGRDRLRELIDAVLDGVHPDGDTEDGVGDARRLDKMARDAYASPWHFSRQFRRNLGEPPVALRRRVLLERAGWQIANGTSVTSAAFGAGYDSVDGFSRAYARAFGYPPSSTRAGEGRHWLPAPNGIHFHPPTSLWVEQHARESPGMGLISHLLHHDVDDTRHLIAVANRLSEEEYRRARMPGHTVLPWDGEEASVAAVLERLVFTKEVWLASIEGSDFPEAGGDAPEALEARHESAASRWLAAVADIDQRHAWGDTLIDALCDPPESFVLGSVVAHVLTYSAYRRQLVRYLMREAGLGAGDGVDNGDPIEWLRGTAQQTERPRQEQQ